MPLEINLWNEITNYSSNWVHLYQGSLQIRNNYECEKTINFMNTKKIAQVTVADLLVYSPRTILTRSVTY